MSRSAAGSHWIGHFVAALLAMTVCGGCGGADFAEIVPAGGIVKFKGQPLEGAVVLFTPDGGGQTARGITDATGTFEMTTQEDKDGAMVGRHTVTISKREDLPPLPKQDPDRPPIPDARPPAKSLIPEKYSQIRSTTLKAEVKEDSSNQFSFDVSE